MKEEKFALPLFIIGVVGMAAGMVASKIYEKRLQKQLGNELEFNRRLHLYADNLRTATEQYCANVNEVCAEADSLLAKIEASEQMEEES